MRTILYILIVWIFYTVMCYSQAAANQPPTIECPSIKNEYIADTKKTTTTVSWSTPTVSDPDNNIESVRQVTAKMPGDKFGRGHHSVIYVVTDQEGLTNMCSVSFSVKVIECRPVYYIRNGQLVCDGYIYGMTCEFMCDEGYKLKENSTTSCQKSGRWSSDSPQCLVNTTVASDVNTTATNSNNDSNVNNVNTLTIAPSVAIFLLLVVIVTLVIYLKVTRSKTETSGASGIADSRYEHVYAHYDNAEVDRGRDVLPQDGNHQVYTHDDNADVDNRSGAHPQVDNPQISRDTRNTYSDLSQYENPDNKREYSKLRLYGNTTGACASVQTSNYQDLRVYGNQGDNQEYGKIQSSL